MMSIIKPAIISIAIVAAILYLPILASMVVCGISDVIKGLYKHNLSVNFYFTTIKKYCEELNICSFTEANANKKDCELNTEIQYRKKYLRVKLIKK